MSILTEALSWRSLGSTLVDIPFKWEGGLLVPYELWFRNYSPMRAPQVLHIPALWGDHVIPPPGS